MLACRKYSAPSEAMRQSWQTLCYVTYFPFGVTLNCHAEPSHTPLNNIAHFFRFHAWHEDFFGTANDRVMARDQIPDVVANANDKDRCVYAVVGQRLDRFSHKAGRLAVFDQVVFVNDYDRDVVWRKKR